MIDDSELFSGLAFLRRYCRADYVDALGAAVTACTEVRRQIELEETRKSPVGNLELSIRAANALNRMGCMTIGDVECLMARSKSDLVVFGKRYNFLMKSIKEVRLLLKSLGLRYQSEASAGSEGR